ncbi:class I SAM-dependent methyltransferase [Numidum massiliense]|uniref:class I SAM-dependent methyltransferase n=1 Tax=Numidum massiliense TaxID=1522315 RepID=UPI0006D55B0A|nr:methyltransferase [Numidum massiliense]
MRDHYYSRDPQSAHKTHEFHTEIGGREFTFTTDSGVFSKLGVDYGTRVLLESLPLPLSGDVLDVGCGYGPIGIAVAVASPKARVTMIDVNRRAIELCRLNAEKNGVSGVSVLESDGLSQLTGRAFDWVLTNPPIRAGKRTVYRLLREVSAHLREGGEFWLVIQKKQGAPSAVKKLRTLFADVSIASRHKGYNVIRCIR